MDYIILCAQIPNLSLHHETRTRICNNGTNKVERSSQIDLDLTAITSPPPIPATIIMYGGSNDDRGIVQ